MTSAPKLVPENAAPPGGAAPVFLVGARRSGTTLMRVMLNAHPEILFFNRWEEAADAIAALPASSDGLHSLKGLEPFRAADVASFAQAANERIAQARTAAARPLFGATCHIGFLELLKVWPDARFVHLIRDPRDVAISFRSLGWSAHPFCAASAWETAERDWERLCELTQAEQRFDLRYEDLVARPEAELQRLCRFLGLAYTDKMFDYTETTSYSYPKKELAERWRGKLSERECMWIESSVAEFLEARGYAPSVPARRFGGGARAWFALQDWFGVRSRRVKSRGLGRVLLGRLVRSFGSHAMKQRFEAAEQSRHEAHVKSLEKRY